MDDVGYLRALIDKIEQDYSIDPKRIYATGILNGGMMSYRLACEGGQNRRDRPRRRRAGP